VRTPKGVNVVMCGSGFFLHGRGNRGVTVRAFARSRAFTVLRDSIVIQGTRLCAVVKRSGCTLRRFT